MFNRHFRCSILLVVFVGARAALAADDPCASFKWDITRERALFSTVGEAVTAGRDAASAPAVVPDRLYELAITPQAQVMFEVPPGKRTLVDGASGGLARLHLPTTGRYRVSVDQSFWIDVVDDHRLIAAEDFQGRPGCSSPHKIVLYSLPGGGEVILQLSGGVGSHVRLAIVPMLDAPSAK